MSDEPTLPLEPPPQPASGRPKRPTCRDATIVDEAARSLVATMRSRGILKIADGEVDDRAADIAKCARYESDGYRIAKELDGRCYWFCNFGIAEALDDFSLLVNSILHRAEKKWAAENGVAPPFPIGTRLLVSSTERGIIDRIYEYGAAKYAVAIDGDAKPDRRIIINFEDAVAESPT